MKKTEKDRRAEEVVFFDRGIPDALCMLDAVRLLSTVELHRFCLSIGTRVP